MTGQVLPLLMSCLGKILASVVSHCLPRSRSLGFGVSFSHDGHVFVLQACYQHPIQTNSISILREQSYIARHISFADTVGGWLC